MPGRGGGRFGKYGELKRKERMRQARLPNQKAVAGMIAGRAPAGDRKRKAGVEKS